MAVDVRRAAPAELSACLALRERVFVKDQGVPPELERDGLDPEALHVLAVEAGIVVGTARLRVLDAKQVKAERVCVAPERRGQGLGAALMAAVEAEARGLGRRELVLAAQRPVIPFYERLGYRGEGPVFFEAGLAHRKMRKSLDT